jgi:hypothetical protein
LGGRVDDRSGLRVLVAEEIEKAAWEAQGGGHVYLMQCGDLYKVGMSQDPERRRRQVSLSVGQPVVLLFTVKTSDMANCEAAWHQRFAAVRRTGEWFALEDWMLKEFQEASVEEIKTAPLITVAVTPTGAEQWMQARRVVPIPPCTSGPGEHGGAAES